VHVALGEIAAAGVERQPPGGGQEVLHHEEIVGLLRGEEAVLDQAHEHAAGEVLVALHHVHVARAEARHLVELRRHRGEGRRGVEWRVVGARGVPVLRALRGAQEIGRARLEIARPLGGDDHERGGAVVLHAAVEEAEGLHDPARGVVRLRGQRPPVHNGSRVGLRMMI
jgi:hypothetical protein